MSIILKKTVCLPAIFAAFALALLALGTSGCASTERPSLTAKTGRPDFTTWLCGKHWLLAGYCPGATFISLEPEHGTSAFIVFNTDGTARGSTGVNEFTGVWTAKKPDKTGTASFSFKLTKVSSKKAPNDIAALFDRDVLRLLEKAKALKPEKDFIRLMGERDETLLRFIVRSKEQ
jgi:heat shock protein HslJ